MNTVVAHPPMKYRGMKGVLTKGMAAARNRVEYAKRMRYRARFAKNLTLSLPETILNCESSIDELSNRKNWIIGILLAIIGKKRFLDMPIKSIAKITASI
jgi:hypothetical protein